MKKNNTYTHLTAALYFCSLAIAICAMAFTFNSCQEEEFGFTRAEIAASASQRHYAEAFQKEFAKIDPNHTWMCEPDTVYGAGLRPLTRAGATIPNVYKTDDIMTITYDNVRAALGFLEEAADNRGVCGQDFEYVSTTEKCVFDIHPTFWGRKFCNHNAVGVWYIDDNGNKVDLAPFWRDWDELIYAVCEHGDSLKVQNTTSPITDKRDEAWNENIALTLHSTCNSEEFTPQYNWRGQVSGYKCDKCGQTYNNKPNKCTKQRIPCPVDHYEFPSYKIEVPVGMKWGLYLETKQNQSSGSPTIKWYSNAEYNVNKCSAAASFEFGGINYVSFEDAPNPYNCQNTDKSQTGTCPTCAIHPENHQHFGHFDHDMNDIVLAITPHPIESTYKAIKYRVMCEDLGGTFDWDFNDLVLDVIYEEGTQQGAKATTKINVMAIGGTLPIELLYDGSSVQGELHTWFGQSPDPDNLYEPINVIGSHTATPSKEAYTINHNWTIKTEGYDVREVVKHISVKVNEHTSVVFPDSEGGEIPQCFMCPINVDWSPEIINISTTYPDFPAWVALQGNTDWWKSGFNTGQQVVEN